MNRDKTGFLVSKPQLGNIKKYQFQAAILNVQRKNPLAAKAAFSLTKGD